VNIAADGDTGAPHDEGTTVLTDRLKRVLASGDPRLERLSSAGTSVSFQITGAPHASVTMLLDRRPPALARGHEPAEITLELTREQEAALARGRLSAPTALLGGKIPYRGPVRKYLAIHPVLSGLLADLDAARLNG
jgi:hypothetical protein